MAQDNQDMNLNNTEISQEEVEYFENEVTSVQEHTSNQDVLQENSIEEKQIIEDVVDENSNDNVEMQPASVQVDEDSSDPLVSREEKSTFANKAKKFLSNKKNLGI